MGALDGYGVVGDFNALDEVTDVPLSELWVVAPQPRPSKPCKPPQVLLTEHTTGYFALPLQRSDQVQSLLSLRLQPGVKLSEQLVVFDCALREGREGALDFVLYDLQRLAQLSRTGGVVGVLFALALNERG